MYEDISRGKATLTWCDGLSVSTETKNSIRLLVPVALTSNSEVTSAQFQIIGTNGSPRRMNHTSPTFPYLVQDGRTRNDRLVASIGSELRTSFASSIGRASCPTILPRSQISEGTTNTRELVSWCETKQSSSIHDHTQIRLELQSTLSCSLLPCSGNSACMDRDWP